MSGQSHTSIGLTRPSRERRHMAKKAKKAASTGPKEVSCLRHFKAYASLTGPVNLAVVLPAVLLYQTVKEGGWAAVRPCFVFELGTTTTAVSASQFLDDVMADRALLAGAVGGLAGVGVMLYAVALLRAVVQLFHDAGGTFAHNDPPSSLVIAGPYLYVRHPMSIAVILLLAAEGVLLGLGSVLGIAAAYAVGVAIYQCCKEEPELRERYGAQCEEYEANVGGWWPRCSAWDPGLLQV